MPITIKEIKDHKDYYGLHDFDTISIDKYCQALDEGAILWIDHHDFVRSTFSGEILATNDEQLDAFIEHLKEYSNRMKNMMNKS